MEHHSLGLERVGVYGMLELGGIFGVLVSVVDGVGFGVVVLRGRGWVLCQRIAKYLAKVALNIL